LNQATGSVEETNHSENSTQKNFDPPPAAGTPKRKRNTPKMSG
jgi:hypothetical protein